jgi:hypothetical protein
MGHHLLIQSQTHQVMMIAKRNINHLTVRNTLPKEGTAQEAETEITKEVIESGQDHEC